MLCYANAGPAIVNSACSAVHDMQAVDFTGTGTGLVLAHTSQLPVNQATWHHVNPLCFMNHA
jgi:hypothetical protein